MKQVFQAAKMTASAMKAMVEYWVLHQKNKDKL